MGHVFLGNELIDNKKLCDEATEILTLICSMLREAISNSYEVYIARK